MKKIKKTPVSDFTKGVLNRIVKKNSEESSNAVTKAMDDCRFSGVGVYRAEMKDGGFYLNEEKDETK